MFGRFDRLGRLRLSEQFNANAGAPIYLLRAFCIDLPIRLAADGLSLFGLLNDERLSTSY